MSDSDSGEYEPSYTASELTEDLHALIDDVHNHCAKPWASFVVAALASAPAAVGESGVLAAEPAPAANASVPLTQ